MSHPISEPLPDLLNERLAVPTGQPRTARNRHHCCSCNGLARPDSAAVMARFLPPLALLDSHSWDPKPSVFIPGQPALVFWGLPPIAPPPSLGSPSLAILSLSPAPQPGPWK